MATVIKAHLNGGPKDDQRVAVDRDEFLVAGTERPSLMQMDESMMVTIKKGTYKMRRDFVGNPVPHDLTGFVEFDWKGWG